MKFFVGGISKESINSILCIQTLGMEMMRFYMVRILNFFSRNQTITRPGVDKVKSEVWFRYSLYVDWHFNNGLKRKIDVGLEVSR